MDNIKSRLKQLERLKRVAEDTRKNYTEEQYKLSLDLMHELIEDMKREQELEAESNQLVTFEEEKKLK